MNTKYAQSQPVAVSLTGALMTVAQAVGVALALVVAAKLRIYLPWSPVPITLQTFVMLTAGAALPISAAAGGAASSFLPQAATDRASSEAISRVFFIVFPSVLSERKVKQSRKDRRFAV